jgi:hypothetical protein
VRSRERTLYGQAARRPIPSRLACPSWAENMAHWFRVYDELVDDPKVQRLPADLFKLLINLWCITSKNGGKLPAPELIAYTVRADESQLITSMKALASHGLLDLLSNQHGSWWAPHGWSKRQFKSDSSISRVKRFRAKNETVDETPPETDSDTEQIQIQNQSRTEKKETRARGALAPDWPADYAEQFWQAFPNKIGRKDALRKLENVGKSGKVSFLHLMAALYRYAGKTDDRPFCNPATWINQERWFDQPAMNGNGHRPRKLNASQQAERLAEIVRARERQGSAGGKDDLFGSAGESRGDVEIIPPQRA